MPFSWIPGVGPGSVVEAAHYNEVKTNIDWLYTTLSLTYTGCVSGAGWTLLPVTSQYTCQSETTSIINSTQMTQLRQRLDYSYDHMCSSYLNGDLGTEYSGQNSSDQTAPHNTGYLGDDVVPYDGYVYPAEDSGAHPSENVPYNSGQNTDEETTLETGYNLDYKNTEYSPFDASNNPAQNSPYYSGENTSVNSSNNPSDDTTPHNTSAMLDDVTTNQSPVYNGADGTVNSDQNTGVLSVEDAGDYTGYDSSYNPTYNYPVTYTRRPP